MEVISNSPLLVVDFLNHQTALGLSYQTGVLSVLIFFFR
jgi:hypothetical protein